MTRNNFPSLIKLICFCFQASIVVRKNLNVIMKVMVLMHASVYTEVTTVTGTGTVWMGLTSIVVRKLTQVCIRMIFFFQQETHNFYKMENKMQSPGCLKYG